VVTRNTTRRKPHLSILLGSAMIRLSRTVTLKCWCGRWQPRRRTVYGQRQSGTGQGEPKPHRRLRLLTGGRSH